MSELHCLRAEASPLPVDLQQATVFIAYIAVTGHQWTCLACGAVMFGWEPPQHICSPKHHTAEAVCR